MLNTQLLGLLTAMSDVSNLEIVQKMTAEEIQELILSFSDMAFSLQQLSNLAEHTSDRLLEIRRLL